MKKQIKMSEYGFNNYIVKDKGENYSDIVTKMVQLAGRLCEKYASDIIYDANAFIKAIAEDKDFDRYLVYREMGVTALNSENLDMIDDSDYIQVWHLTYNATTKEQKFARMSVYFERRYF
jgi:hypothetical protein